MHVCNSNFHPAMISLKKSYSWCQFSQVPFWKRRPDVALANYGRGFHFTQLRPTMFDSNNGRYQISVSPIALKVSLAWESSWQENGDWLCCCLYGGANNNTGNEHELNIMMMKCDLQIFHLKSTFSTQHWATKLSKTFFYKTTNPALERFGLCVAFGHNQSYNLAPKPAFDSQKLEKRAKLRNRFRFTCTSLVL